MLELNNPRYFETLKSNTFNNLFLPTQNCLYPASVSCNPVCTGWSGRAALQYYFSQLVTLPVPMSFLFLPRSLLSVVSLYRAIYLFWGKQNNTGFSYKKIVYLFVLNAHCGRQTMENLNFEVNFFLECLKIMRF